MAIACLFLSNFVLSQGEASTYFNIFVPPNNLSIQRNVALIVTAINDNTIFTIEDDAQDGDSDDSVTGELMAGQSYVLYIKDNGINDDGLYASGGVLKRDGDYFKINSSKVVFASMSTDSDWQHDFVPSVNKKNIGQKFFVYSPKSSSSLRDLNVFAYEAGTKITISKISTSPTTNTGYTNIDLENKMIIIDRNLNPGEDIIHFYTNGRNCMDNGGTYLIETNKDVSVQYGALWENSRDGGGSVPSNLGSAGGDLFYFAVPYQSVGEQEIRVVSWDPSNNIQLSRYSNGTWINMSSWTLNTFQTGDWVGKQNGNVSYATVFRVTCTPGKKISVFEANWMETGSNATSDMATMVSSSNGTSSGKNFIAYLLPPSSQNNVINPNTGAFYAGSISHLYLFAGSDNTTVTIKDAKTNGATLTKTFQITAGNYADAFFTLNEWKSIYNGTGTTSGPDRPYLKIEATANISVLSTNFNDNWMTYFGSSLPQSFTQTGALTPNNAIPGDTILMTSTLEMPNGTIIETPDLELKIGSGLIPISSKLTNTENGSVIFGDIQQTEDKSTISYTIENTIDVTDNYVVETEMHLSTSYNNATQINNGTVLTVETHFSGVVDGELQESILSKGVQNNAANTSNLLFSECHTNSIGNTAYDSWNGAWVDYDQDGWEDLFVAGRKASDGNELYKNNAGTGFTKISNSAICQTTGQTSAAIWGDINNDRKPDVLLVNETLKKSELYLNNGNGQFTFLPNSGLDIEPNYFHGAAFADFDNDGFLDFLITNFFETKFHQLYRNSGNNTFELITNTPVSSVSARATSPVLGDYNNDGLVDVFIPNGNNEPNSLFKNIGGFQFEQVTTGAIVTDLGISVGGAWGDYNNDGFMDLFVVNSSNQNNVLYKNNGNETFTSISGITPTMDGGHSHSASWMDVNNDSHLDLYVTNDVGFKHLYLNDGNGNFIDKILEVVAADYGAANGAAWSDYNRDGQLDFVAFTHGQEKNHFFCNNGNANNWITFELKGNVSNSMAFGAQVKVLSGNKWQMAQVLPVSGFGSQNSMKVHFGLGSNTQIDSAIVLWPSGIRQNIENKNINSFNLVMEDDSKKVIGQVFNDLNGNGMKDGTETNLSNIAFKMMPNGVHFTSNQDGNFELNVTDAQVNFSLQNNATWNLLTTNSFSFEPNQDTLYVNIALQAIIYSSDLSVSFGTTAWRRGFENNTVVTCKNEGSRDALGVNVNMNYPTKVSLISASMDYESSAANSYQFTIDTLKAGESISLIIIDKVGLNATVGETCLLAAQISETQTEINLVNNNYSEEITIVGAIDPNDILVSPKGDGSAGYVEKGTWLTYTIRFENVGSWYATFVNLQSKIDADLDVNQFEFISSSHEANYRFDSQNNLYVSFNQIQLPPVEMDSIGSQGFFKYRIKTKEDCIGGEQIIGQAEITFDFEAPVITNTVLNTLKRSDEEIDSKLFIFPNPASEVITIEIQQDAFAFDNLSNLVHFQIMNSLGNVVEDIDLSATKMFSYSVAHLAAGTYYLKAFDEEGNHYTSKMIKK